MRPRLFPSKLFVLLIASLASAVAQTADPPDLLSLKQLALREINLNQQRNLDLDPEVQRSASALKRWYELDPLSAREAILHEITSPAPRFGAETLGILPDPILESEQHIIAQHYIAALAPIPALPERPTRAEWMAHINRYNTLAGKTAAEKHLASLLFRYAGPDVVPEFLPTLQDRSAHPNCDAQNFMLAFLLKLKSDQAEPLISTAVANRPPGHTPCIQSMYTQIGHLIVSPLLERFALEALDDSDTHISLDALYYLRDHGSPQAEQPVFDRLVRWNAQWRDHVSDLIGLPGQFDGDNLVTARFNPNQDQASLGSQLVQTLVYGHGWLASEARLRQLLSLVLVPGEQSSVNAALQQLQKSPIHIYLTADSPLMFIVAQYQLASLDDLENKLTQYPPGTAFIYADHRAPRRDSPQPARDLAQWSAVKGVQITGLTP